MKRTMRFGVIGLVLLLCSTTKSLASERWNNPDWSEKQQWEAVTKGDFQSHYFEMVGSYKWGKTLTRVFNVNQYGQSTVMLLNSGCFQSYFKNVPWMVSAGASKIYEKVGLNPSAINKFRGGIDDFYFGKIIAVSVSKKAVAFIVKLENGEFIFTGRAEYCIASVDELFKDNIKDIKERIVQKTMKAAQSSANE
jgi:hypothetical protein